MRERLSSENNHLSITGLTARSRKNYSCVLGMTMSGLKTFLWINHLFVGLFLVIVRMRSVLWSCSLSSRYGLIYWILHLVLTQRATTMLLVLFVLNFWSVKMPSIVLCVSVKAPRDSGIWYWSLYRIFLFLGYWFCQRGSLHLLNSWQRASSCT